MSTTNRKATAVAAAAVGGAIAGLVLLRRRDEQAVAADPEQAALFRPVSGEPVAVRSADGTLLHAEVFGARDAPTIVLVHGWAVSTRFWQYQLLSLPGTYRVVTYDLRGHGQSGRPVGGDYSTHALAADLDAVLSACVPEGEKVVVAGHSMGAMSIVAWAGRRPDEVARRLTGAVLVSTAVEKLIAEARIFATMAVLSRLTSAFGRFLLRFPIQLPRGSNPLLTRVVRYVALSPGASPAQVALTERLFLECKAEVRAAFGRTLSTLDLASSLQSLTVPTVVMVGSADRMTPPKHARAMVEALPRAELVDLAGVGHMAPLEAPAEVTEGIRRMAERTLRAEATAHTR